jgi:two-component system, LuxR family, response regulator FixJ
MLSLPDKSTVYVVDDDQDVLGSLQFLLETDGFHVRTFRSGAALLRAVASNAADCFVIDYKMPNMNGIDLAKRLRGRDIAAPIILITGHPDGNIPERAATAGVHMVLLKPHLEDSLASHIRGAIQASRPHH